MLEHHCENVASYLESQFDPFTFSHPPKFRPKKLLFYLIRWQKCCFEWLYLNAFFQTRSLFDSYNCSIYIRGLPRSLKTHPGKLYNICLNLQLHDLLMEPALRWTLYRPMTFLSPAPEFEPGTYRTRRFFDSSSS